MKTYLFVYRYNSLICEQDVTAVDLFSAVCQFRNEWRGKNYEIVTVDKIERTGIVTFDFETEHFSHGR